MADDKECARCGVDIYEDDETEKIDDVSRIVECDDCQEECCEGCTEYCQECEKWYCSDCAEGGFQCAGCEKFLCPEHNDEDIEAQEKRVKCKKCHLEYCDRKCLNTECSQGCGHTGCGYCLYGDHKDGQCDTCKYDQQTRQQFTQTFTPDSFFAPYAPQELSDMMCDYIHR